MEVRFVEGVAELAPEAWDALVGDNAPFFEHAFLAAAEAYSATPRHGAQPIHLTLWDQGELIAAVPLYVKGDGRAEFIYDYGWYHVAYQLGFEYYPKLVSMAPFTPATGAHFLIRADQERAGLLPMLADVVEQFARANELTGVHFLFLPEDEASQLAELGYHRRLTFQLGLEERFESFDDFLGRFRSKDRVKFKRDLRIVREDQGIEIRAWTGDQLGERELDDMYRYYCRTVRDHGTGSHYLQEGSWRALWAGWRHRLVVFFAEQAGRRIAGSICAWKDGVLYGRYWGSDGGHYPSLYFNLAFYEPTRWMIEQGGRAFYAGFGNARYKHQRGLDPSPTHSAHKLFDPGLHGVIGEICAREQDEAAETIAAIRARSKRIR